MTFIATILLTFVSSTHSSISQKFQESETSLLMVDRELQIDATTLLGGIVVLRWHILILFSDLAVFSLVC